MSTTTADPRDEAIRGAVDDIVHATCCDEDRALCGEVCVGYTVVYDGPVTCPMCVMLSQCSMCGDRFA